MTSNSISANDEIGRLLGDVCEDELNTTFDFDCRWGLKMEGFQLVLESFSFAQSQILDSKERSYQNRKGKGRQEADRESMNVNQQKCQLKMFWLWDILKIEDDSKVFDALNVYVNALFNKTVNKLAT